MKKKVVGIIIFLFIIINGIFFTDIGKGLLYYNNNLAISRLFDNYHYGFVSGPVYKDGIGTIKFKYFVGKDNFLTMVSKQDTKLIFDLDIDIKSGEFKMVLLNSKKKVENLAEGNFKGKVKIPLTEGENHIKILSKGSEGELSLEIEENENIIVE